MGENETVEFVRLAGAQIDDQAIAEISRLLRPAPDGAEVTLARLIRLAAEGPLIVARRPCGELPEIVGVAGLTADPQGRASEVIALDPDHAEAGLEAALRAVLAAQAQRPAWPPRRTETLFCWERRLRAS